MLLICIVDLADAFPSYFRKPSKSPILIIFQPNHRRVDGTAWRTVSVQAKNGPPITPPYQLASVLKHSISGKCYSFSKISALNTVTYRHWSVYLPISLRIWAVAPGMYWRISVVRFQQVLRLFPQCIPVVNAICGREFSLSTEFGKNAHSLVLIDRNRGFLKIYDNICR